MDNSECPNLNLNKICRACMRENETMKQLVDNDQQEESLLKMFLAVSSIELRDAEVLPMIICGECVEKLNVSYKFRLQCQQSNILLLQYVRVNTKEVDIEDDKPVDGIQSEDPSDNHQHTESEDSDYKSGTPKNHSNRKQTMRLVQYSYDEVTRAIEESRRKFFENTECIRCGFVGSNARALSVHVSHLHKELKERWCAQCNVEVENLREHNKIHDDLKCQFCEKLFQAKGHLTEHLRSHSGVRPYKCDACDKCFISQRHLKVHLRIHSNERPYKCKVCQRTFIQHISLKSHLKRHEKSRGVYRCRFCKTDFKSIHVYNEHDCESKRDSECDGDEQYSSESLPQNFCVKCNKKVRSLSLHDKQTHSEGSKLLNEYGDNILDNKLCTVCGKQFRTTSKLRVHMRVHTGEAPYKCSFCNKRVTTRNQLVVHERIHTGEKPHVCHVCGKGFAQSSVLNTHMRLHTGRPEVCKICDQRFCRPAELRLHMRKHTGEKPFLCTECGQAFVQRSHLVEHNKTHSDLRPYQCTYCEKAFKQNSSLKSHVQIHLGCKPFKCSQCSYACRQSYSLTQHMKQHANDAPRPDRPHSCLICNKTFSTVAMLSSHAATVHNVNPTIFE